MAQIKIASVSSALYLALVGSSALLAQDVSSSPNLYNSTGETKVMNEQVNPWGGLDISGNLHGLLADQISVDENGNIHGLQLSPSVAVGDLNGDGLLDLVVADPKGYFWYFPNSGTKTQPKFTKGEVMPIWLGSPGLTPTENHDLTPKESEGRAMDHLVPRIQLVDFDGDGKLDIIAGTYPGKLFLISNSGSAVQPRFVTPKNLRELRDIPTRVDGRLDCNFFSPYLYDLLGTGRMDLLKGDGTYSANSIYLYTNKGSNSQPVLSDADRVKLIPGMGREHLVPQVVDWNNDGKPDIITGERAGFVNLFLNTGPDQGHPSFDEGQHIKFGGVEKFGQFTTVTPCALSGNPQVPDVLISNDTGQILYCHNAGTPGKPSFPLAPQPLKGMNPYPNILVSSDWALGWWDSFHPYPLRGWSEGAPYGVPYELLVVANAAKEPGFAPPSGVTWKNAIKYEVVDHKNTYFTDSYYPKNEIEAEKHSIFYTQNAAMLSETQYQVSFWIKCEGVHDLSYHFHGGQLKHPELDDHSLNWVDITNPVNAGSSWVNVKDTITWNTTNNKRHDTVGFWFAFNFYGQGTVYLADLEIHKM